jgi:ubiquinone/menaquinone biosynthesis C-methylase UbiE
MPVDSAELRRAIERVYTEVVNDPKKGYHFHTGAEYAVERLGYIRDMTEAMLLRGRENIALTGLAQIDYRAGLAESLPVDDASVDLVISNGVINLSPDKDGVLREAFRVLRPGGRLQIADIVVHKDIPPAGREDIAIWTA